MQKLRKVLSEHRVAIAAALVLSAAAISQIAQAWDMDATYARELRGQAYGHNDTEVNPYALFEILQTNYVSPEELKRSGSRELSIVMAGPRLMRVRMDSPDMDLVAQVQNSPEADRKAYMDTAQSVARRGMQDIADMSKDNPGLYKLANHYLTVYEYNAGNLSRAHRAAEEAGDRVTAAYLEFCRPNHGRGHWKEVLHEIDDQPGDLAYYLFNRIKRDRPDPGEGCNISPLVNDATQRVVHRHWNEKGWWER